MKKIILIFTLLSWTIIGTAQEMDADALPTGTLSNDFFLTLDPAVPVSPYYKVDISHMGFTNEADAVKQCRDYLTANLISNEVFYDEGYMIVRIHTEYMDGDLNYDKPLFN